MGKRKSKVCDCEGQHQGIVVPEAYPHGVRFGQTFFFFRMVTDDPVLKKLKFIQGEVPKRKLLEQNQRLG